MSLKASVFIATSLDGFIAREDGVIDWLMDADRLLPAGEDCGYADFMSGMDVLIMGRNTYEQVAGFEVWPYEGKRVVVLTSRPVCLRVGPGIRLECSAESPKVLLNRLAAEGFRQAYVDGGKVIQSFLAEGLIQNMTLTVIPVLIGAGRRLFGSLPEDTKWQLVSFKAYDFGFTQATYTRAFSSR